MADPFHSSRLLYRAAELTKDVPFLTALGQDYDAAANLNPNLILPTSSSDVEERLKASKERNLLHVIICLPSVPPANDPGNVPSAPEPTPIGVISLTKSPSPGMIHHRNSMIGVSIMKPYQSQGYGAEAINWILDYGFRVAGLHRISLTYFSWNVGAGRLYEKLGFVLEGRQRECLWHDGGWHDHIEASMLEYEWRDRQREKKQA